MPGTVAATRIQSLDVIRGFAILGILLANIATFAGPDFSRNFGAAASVDSITHLFNQGEIALAAGKFRSSLAILFGYGLYLQFQKAEAGGKAWPQTYFRRALLLGVLGFIHGFFIWIGDILFSYAVVSFIAAFLVKSDERGLLWIIAGVFGLNFLFAGIFGLAIAFGPESGGSGGIDFYPFRPSDEIAAFAKGTYFDQLKYRGILWIVMTLFIVLTIIPSLLALFSIGILMARQNFLVAPSAHPKLRNGLLWAGLGLGIPLNLVAFLLPHKALSSASIAWELFCGPLLAVGLVTGIASLVEAGKTGFLGRMFGQVGKIALTNYILQSLLCTTFFYSWGFGYFGKLNRPQEYMVVLGVWVINFIFSAIWLRKFDIGPVEWLWRSAVAKKRLPWRTTSQLVDA
jgi:uncharacterized protein